MSAALIALALGIASTIGPILFSDHTAKRPTGRTPHDPLPPPSGALPPHANLILADEAMLDAGSLTTALRALMPKATPSLIGILAAHALTAGGGAPVPNHNPFFIPAWPNHTGLWSLIPVEAATPQGQVFRLRPVRAYPTLLDGLADAIRTLPSEALKAASKGDVEGYVAALVKASATARVPRRFVEDIRAAANGLTIPS